MLTPDWGVGLAFEASARLAEVAGSEWHDGRGALEAEGTPPQEVLHIHMPGNSLLSFLSLAPSPCLSIVDLVECAQNVEMVVSPSGQEAAVLVAGD